MNDTKLTDFRAEELQVLLVEVTAACIREAGTKGVRDYTKYNTLSLWKVQILNAISTVQMREREISN